MTNPHRLAGILALLTLILTAFAPPAQTPIVELSVTAGYDGRFRDSEWLPVAVTLRNTGDDFEGRLIVRPETSGAGITNTYSAPVTLPSGGAQRVTLYVTARNFATQIRAELMANDGTIIAAEPTPIQGIQPLDQLYAVITDSAVGSLDLTGARFGSYNAYQVNWEARDVPEHAAALAPVDALLVTDTDSSGLSEAQRQAIESWVLDGGHLIVTGGANWQATAAGLGDLLPMEPTGSEVIANLSPLARWLKADAPRRADTLAATGSLREGARVLVESDGQPLVVRRAYGSGTVDYVTVDPNAQPLRGWNALTEFWLALLTTTGAVPSWSNGFTSWDLAGSAVEILPGYDLLPDVLPLCGFLGLYIALMGPVNYWVLARLNRRELAWITIPALIIVFSGLAWFLGFNLRGTEATLSRLSVVRAWPEGERATVDSLIGLLSPRRAQYTLALADSGTLRPIPGTLQGSVLTANARAAVEIVQTERFAATNFTVDASFIAGFNSSGVIDRPAVGGTASMRYEGATGEQRVRGSVRNDSDKTLHDPVILARGVAMPLGEAIEPGDVQPFDLTIPADSSPAPAIRAAAAVAQPYSYSSYLAYGGPMSGQTVIDILGPEEYPPAGRETAAIEEDRRRRLFLASFIADFYAYSGYGAGNLVSTGRGDNVYLAAWVDEAPIPVELEGAGWSSEDTTIYLVQLDVEDVLPSGEITIGPGQFTWLGEESNGLGFVSPVNLSLQPGAVVTFRYTPLPDAVLADVDRLAINLIRPNLANTDVPILVYNWETDLWDEIDLEDGRRVIRDPEEYLGPQNSVMLRLEADALGGYMRLERLVVEQTGRF